MHSIDNSDSNSTMHSINNSYAGDKIISNFHEFSGKDWDRSPNTFIDKVITELVEILGNRNRSPSNEDGQNEQNNGVSKGKKPRKIESKNTSRQENPPGMLEDLISVHKRIFMLHKFKHNSQDVLGSKFGIFSDIKNTTLSLKELKKGASENMKELRKLEYFRDYLKKLGGVHTMLSGLITPKSSTGVPDWAVDVKKFIDNRNKFPVIKCVEDIMFLVYGLDIDSLSEEIYFEIKRLISNIKDDTLKVHLNSIFTKKRSSNEEFRVQSIHAPQTFIRSNDNLTSSTSNVRLNSSQLEFAGEIFDLMDDYVNKNEEYTGLAAISNPYTLVNSASFGLGKTSVCLAALSAYIKTHDFIKENTIVMYVVPSKELALDFSSRLPIDVAHWIVCSQNSCDINNSKIHVPFKHSPQFEIKNCSSKRSVKFANTLGFDSFYNNYKRIMKWGTQDDLRAVKTSKGFTAGKWITSRYQHPSIIFADYHTAKNIMTGERHTFLEDGIEFITVFDEIPATLDCNAYANNQLANDCSSIVDRLMGHNILLSASLTPDDFNEGGVMLNKRVDGKENLRFSSQCYEMNANSFTQLYRRSEKGDHEPVHVFNGLTETSIKTIGGWDSKVYSLIPPNVFYLLVQKFNEVSGTSEFKLESCFTVESLFGKYQQFVNALLGKDWDFQRKIVEYNLNIDSEDNVNGVKSYVRNISQTMIISSSKIQDVVYDLSEKITPQNINNIMNNTKREIADISGSLPALSRDMSDVEKFQIKSEKDNSERDMKEIKDRTYRFSIQTPNGVSNFTETWYLDNRNNVQNNDKFLTLALWGGNCIFGDEQLDSAIKSLDNVSSTTSVSNIHGMYGIDNAKINTVEIYDTDSILGAHSLLQGIRRAGRSRSGNVNASALIERDHLPLLGEFSSPFKKLRDNIDSVDVRNEQKQKIQKLIETLNQAQAQAEQQAQAQQQRLEEATRESKRQKLDEDVQPEPVVHRRPVVQEVPEEVEICYPTSRISGTVEWETIKVNPNGCLKNPVDAILLGERPQCDTRCTCNFLGKYKLSVSGETASEVYRQIEDKHNLGIICDHPGIKDMPMNNHVCGRWVSGKNPTSAQIMFSGDVIPTSPDQKWYPVPFNFWETYHGKIRYVREGTYNINMLNFNITSKDGDILKFIRTNLSNFLSYGIHFENLHEVVSVFESNNGQIEEFEPTCHWSRLLHDIFELLEQPYRHPLNEYRVEDEDSYISYQEEKDDKLKKEAISRLVEIQNTIPVAEAVYCMPCQVVAEAVPVIKCDGWAKVGECDHMRCKNSNYHKSTTFRCEADVCKFWKQNGFCKNIEDCKFSHNPQDRGEVKQCEHWITIGKTCRYGDECNSWHIPDRENTVAPPKKPCSNWNKKGYGYCNNIHDCQYSHLPENRGDIKDCNFWVTRGLHCKHGVKCRSAHIPDRENTVQNSRNRRR